MTQDPSHHPRPMREARRTQVAQSAADFSEFFNSLLQSVRIAGGCARRPMIVAPEGMSTAGGRQVRQAIVLQPDFAGPPVITIGWVDIMARSATLRTHGCLEKMHRQRYPSHPFDVDAATYDAFLGQAQALMASRQIGVTVQNTPPTVERPESSAVDDGSYSVNVVLGLCALFFFVGAACGAAGMYAYFVGFAP